MKAKINEQTGGFAITLEPESMKEMAELLRYANCAKMEKPRVNFCFDYEPCFLYLYLRKIDKSKQRNHIHKPIVK